MGGGLSKSEQLRGGSDQARRRAERANRAYKPGERNGPDPLSTTDHIITWDQATAEARRLSVEKTNQYGLVWLQTCEAIAAVLLEMGIFNTNELTGRNALAVAKLAMLNLGED